jgi:hypothetical protein
MSGFIAWDWPCSFSTRQAAVAALEEALSAEINISYVAL